MKLFLFILAKAFGGLSAVFGLGLASGEALNPGCSGHPSTEWGVVISYVTIGSLGLYLFIRSDRRIKEIKKAENLPVTKKINQPIGWTVKLILLIIFLLWLVLMALFS
jgi:hypothetical protein